MSEQTLGEKPRRQVKRGAMWQRVLELNIFTIPELAQFSGADRRAVGRYAKSLARGGFAKVLRDIPGAATVYKVVRRNRSGGDKSFQIQLWNSARILKTFTATELVATLHGGKSPHAETVKRWLSHLVAVDVLRSTKVGRQRATFRYQPCSHERLSTRNRGAA